jgi:hypothetical protein
MSLAEFEPTAPVFERAKTVHALDRAATVVVGSKLYQNDTVGICVCVYQLHSLSPLYKEPSAEQFCAPVSCTAWV